MNIFHHCVTNIFTNKTGSHLLYIPSLKHYHWITCSHPDSTEPGYLRARLGHTSYQTDPRRNGAFTVKSGISIVPKLSSRLRPLGRTRPYAGDTTLWIRILCSSRGHNARYLIYEGGTVPHISTAAVYCINIFFVVALYCSQVLLRSILVLYS
jgi:hypothetical protein